MYVSYVRKTERKMKDTKGMCPFDKKVCKEKCVLFRKGMRYWDDPKREPVAFEACAMNIAVDCLENLINRSIGQQKAMEQTRNEMAALKQLFFALASRKAIAEIKQEAIEEARASVPSGDIIEVES